MLIGIESYEGDCLLKGPAIPLTQINRILRSIYKQHVFGRDAFV